MADVNNMRRVGLREADRLALLKSYQVIEAEPVGAFDDAVALAARICAAPIATLAFFEPRRQWFKAKVGLDIAEGSVEGSLNGFAIQKNENLLVIHDIAADGRFHRDPVVRAYPDLGFYAGAVLTTREGAAIGVLGVFGDAPRPEGLDPDQANALLALAGSVMRELEGRKIVARSVDSTREAAAARGPALSREMTNDQLQKVLMLSRTVPWELSLPADRIVLGDNARELLGLGSAVNMPRFREHIHPEDQAIFASVLREAMTGSPGEIEVRFKRTRGRQAWLRVRVEMFSHFSLAGTFVDITAERQRDREFDEAVTRDHLTGLASRSSFQEELQKELKAARMHRTKFALLFVDIDDLEEVNSMFGHHAGDAVLREAARRLSDAVGASGRVGRGRDDEFIIYIRDVADAEYVEKLGARLLAELRRDFTFEGNSLVARASIGAVIFPDHQRDATKLLQSADAALRVAKNSGRDRISLFSTQDTRELDRRARETQALRIGLARNDILPFYQPLFNLQTGDVVSVEALARWRHPSKGVLAANYFQSAFENADTAVDITEAMIRSIAADSRMWQSEGLTGLRVSLNLAEAELRRADISERILTSLASASLPTTLLELEAPEAALLRNDAHTRAALERLRAAGVRITLDNFGKANASLTILRSQRFDHLKIDRSLIGGIEGNPACAAIVASLIALAQEMSMSVSAEGVETISQLEKLRAMRCGRVQGYLLGAPMIASRIPEFIRRLRESRNLPAESYSVIEEPDPFGPAGE